MSQSNKKKTRGVFFSNGAIGRKTIVFVIITIVLLAYILFYSYENDENVDVAQTTRTLMNDGFCVFQKETYVLDVKSKMPCRALQNDVLGALPDGYMFIDYVYKIEQTALSTFHRDVTSSQSQYNTLYPTYTLIIYAYAGELLSICPKSNQTYPFVCSQIYNFHGAAKSAFLFDCEILHAGCLNNCNDRLAIQYKLCHKDDLSKLQHLIGVEKEKKESCEINFYTLASRKLSYFFQMPINCLFNPLMKTRYDENSVLGKVQSLIPLRFYNNE